MKSRTSVHKFSILLGGCLAALALSGGALAQSHGGGGGHASGAAGGGGHASGAAGGGGHGGFSAGYHGGSAGYGYRGGYYGGGYRGGYGYYGGGYRGGYGYYGGGYRGGWGGWGGWGWGGIGLGMYFATLPLYYNTYYWGGVPYYYANDVYYTYDPNAQQYLTVAPPAGLQAQSGQTPAGGSPNSSTELMVYPKNGQTPEQQTQDKFECHQWAVGQTGFDPTTGAATAATANRGNDYMRAQAACLEGRGYSVQ